MPEQANAMQVLKANNWYKWIENTQTINFLNDWKLYGKLRSRVYKTFSIKKKYKIIDNK